MQSTYIMVTYVGIAKCIFLISEKIKNQANNISMKKKFAQGVIDLFFYTGYSKVYKKYFSYALAYLREGGDMTPSPLLQTLSWFKSIYQYFYENHFLEKLKYFFGLKSIIPPHFCIPKVTPKVDTPKTRIRSTHATPRYK